MKFKWVILFLLIPALSQSQNLRKDSLTKLLPSLKGSTRIDCLNKLSVEYYINALSETYKIKLASGSGKTPDWFLPAINQIWILSVVEVSLTYFTIIAFAAALKSANWFRKIPSRIYIIISILAIVCILLQPLYSGSVVFSGFPYYPFMIPAIPFFLIYFIGVNLLRKVGTINNNFVQS